MTNSRLDSYLKQIENIEKKGYKVDLKEDIYLLSKDENFEFEQVNFEFDNIEFKVPNIDFSNIIFESKYLNELESFINAN